MILSEMVYSVGSQGREGWEVSFRESDGFIALLRKTLEHNVVEFVSHHKVVHKVAQLYKK